MRKLHKYGKQAGIPEHKCHPHVLKHSIAIHMVDSSRVTRASEIVGLTTSNVRDGFLIVQRLKGSLRTVQPASHVLIDFVSNLAAGEKVFPLTRR